MSKYNLMTVKVTADELTAFIERVQKVVDKDYVKFMPSHPEWTPQIVFEGGSRYAKLVSRREGTGGSAFGFVDLTNGDVLKAASWKAPAKNFARGNIYDDFGGTGRVRWTGVF